MLAFIGCGGSDPPAADRAAKKTPAPSGRQLAEPLDAELEQRTADAGLQGAASALVVDGELVWSGGAGMADLESGRAMTASTPIYYASISKTVTAALALRLAEQGRLSLDDPVRRWVPEWRGPRSVTLRHLLSQTSGVRDPGPAFFDAVLLHPGRPISPRRLLQPLPPTKSEPGYADANFILAGLALRRAAGRDWARVRHEVAPELVLQPDERVRGRPARFYWYPDGVGDPQPFGDDAGWLPSTAIASVAWTAAGWAGTTEALARWADRLFTGAVLESGSLDQMTDFAASNVLWGDYGLGLSRREEEGEEVWGHTGYGPGIHTELWHLPARGLTLFTVSNDDLVGTPEDQRALLRVALEHL